MRCRLAAIAALLAAIPVVALTTHAATAPNGCAQSAWPATAPAAVQQEPGHVWLCTYTNPADGLSRTAWLYQPSSFTATTPGPLIVVLHGCTEQGPDIAYISHFDVEAEQDGFRVLYPNQAPYTQPANTPTGFDGNGSMCWNWFLPQGQQRGSGEPALIAGLTTQAATLFTTDRRRIDVIGASAGAATADIMAATYPDIYASVGIVAGCEYRGLPCLGAPSAVPPQLSAQLAYQASNHARVVPFLVENGDADPAVPVGNAFEAVQQWQLYDTFAHQHRVDLTAVPSAPCAAQPLIVPPPPQSPYDVYDYSLSGAPCSAQSNAALLGELYIVHGEFHAWPGGSPLLPNEIYTNTLGPDLTHIAYEFFLHHPCRLWHGVCAAPVATRS